MTVTVKLQSRSSQIRKFSRKRSEFQEECIMYFATPVVYVPENDQDGVDVEEGQL